MVIPTSSFWIALEKKYTFNFRGCKDPILAGGWTNQSEKYARQNGFIIPKVRDENKTYLKPPPSISLTWNVL